MDSVVRTELTPEARSILVAEAVRIKECFLALAGSTADPVVVISPGGLIRIAEYEDLVSRLRDLGRPVPMMAPAEAEPSIVVVLGVRKGDTTEEVFVRIPDPRSHQDRWPWAASDFGHPMLGPDTRSSRLSVSVGDPTPKSYAFHTADGVLERYASAIFKRFLEVAGEMIDPAVCVDAPEGEIYIVEHISLIAASDRSDLDPPPPFEPGYIVVAIVDGEDLYRRRIPDPRVHPTKWPWDFVPF